MLVDGVPRKPGFEVRPGMIVDLPDVVETPPHRLEPVAIALDVPYEDDVLLVVNKPRGLAAHPAPNQRSATLVNALLARGHSLSGEAGAYRPGIVHRLDSETTGLMLVAKNDHAHRVLAEQIKAKTAERRYVALVHGCPDQERFRVEAPIGRDPNRRNRMRIDPDGRSAATEAKRLRHLGEGSLMALRLETGRTHQIRVHMLAIGHPVKGDRLYGQGPWAAGPMQLHAAFLAFDHPVSGERMAVYAPPPPDFEAAEWVDRISLELW